MSVRVSSPLRCSTVPGRDRGDPDSQRTKRTGAPQDRSSHGPASPVCMVSALPARAPRAGRRATGPVVATRFLVDRSRPGPCPAVRPATVLPVGGRHASNDLVVERRRPTGVEVITESAGRWGLRPPRTVRPRPGPAPTGTSPRRLCAGAPESGPAAVCREAHRIPEPTRRGSTDVRDTNGVRCATARLGGYPPERVTRCPPGPGSSRRRGAPGPRGVDDGCSRRALVAGDELWSTPANTPADASSSACA